MGTNTAAGRDERIRMDCVRGQKQAAAAVSAADIGPDLCRRLRPSGHNAASFGGIWDLSHTPGSRGRL